MSQEAIRSLEHVRQRLNTLSTQLGSLRRDLEINQGLPAWYDCTFASFYHADK